MWKQVCWVNAKKWAHAISKILFILIINMVLPEILEDIYILHKPSDQCCDCFMFSHEVVITMSAALSRIFCIFFKSRCRIAGFDFQACRPLVLFMLFFCIWACLLPLADCYDYYFDDFCKSCHGISNSDHQSFTHSDMNNTMYQGLDWHTSIWDLIMFLSMNYVLVRLPNW